MFTACTYPPDREGADPHLLGSDLFARAQQLATQLARLVPRLPLRPPSVVACADQPLVCAKEQFLSTCELLHLRDTEPRMSS